MFDFHLKFHFYRPFYSRKMALFNDFHMSEIYFTNCQQPSGFFGVFRQSFGGVLSLVGGGTVGTVQKPGLLSDIRNGVTRGMVNTLGWFCDRTVLEKVMLLGVTSYVGYKMATHYGLHEKLAEMAQEITYPTVKINFGKEAAGGASGMESRRAGSDERLMTPNKSQCIILQGCGSSYDIVGCAVRFRNGYLVGPDHVLSDSSLSSFPTSKFAYGRQGRNNPICLDGLDRIHLSADAVAIKLTDKQFSAIGVAEASITHISRATHVTIVGPEGKGTSGTASNGDFGMVEYAGTTLGGYSGAPYCIGNSIVGIHTNGGAHVNFGFSASYLWMCLCVATNMVDESSEDYLLGQFKAGARLEWRISPGDADMVEVNVGGKYHYVAKRSMSGAFGSDWEASGGKIGKKRRDYDDVMESRDSGEASSSKNLGALNELEDSKEHRERNLQSSINRLKKDLKKSRRDAALAISE